MASILTVFFGGFILHVLLLGSVFEIYFKTPIVPGIQSYKNPVLGPAKRLVFIVADGLRADSFYRNDKESTRFLRAKIESHASWGVSHTRVPTESRPGIVALAAGIYEDPSAVFRGWKSNPAAFDTLFNQSRYTWAWGSPDIVHIFAQDNVESVAYSQEMQDFSGKNATWELDEWVINHVKLFFQRAKVDEKIKKLVHQDKLVFFLHLLGLDTAGHTIKPHSLNYQQNLEVVDRGVQTVEDLFESFFEDSNTAYVFTADHGMTDWGSHGAGSQDETEVPLIAWGAGIKGPTASDAWDPQSPRVWQLGHLKRKDVNQADIVVLLASLIGCNVPVNSVGRLPRAYLDLPIERLARLSLYNAQQLLTQADRKREIIQSHSFSFLFYPFSKLTPEDEKMKLKLIDQFILSQNYDKAIQVCEELIDLSLLALHYYYTYYQVPLLTCTSLSFIGWIIWLVCQLNKKSVLKLNRPGKNTDRFFMALAVILFLLVTAQGMEAQLIVYSLVPVFLWWSVFSMQEFWLKILFSKQRSLSFLGAALLFITFTEIMVASFFQRWVLSVGVLLSALWPLFGKDKFGNDKIRLIPPSMIFKWLLSCVFLALFPLLPVIGSESNLALVTLSGLLWISVLAVSIRTVHGDTTWTKVMHELIPLAVSILINYYVTWSIDLGKGLPVFCQFIAWNLLFFSIIASMFGESGLPKRITKLYATLLTPYMLLCVRHEGLFILALSFHLNCWLILEAKLNGISFPQLQKIAFPPPNFADTLSEIKNLAPQYQNLTFEDYRRAALYVFYMFLAFFGTGNIASLNSFELIWARCFVSVFSPYTMMFLIVVKMLIPFILVTSTFRAVNITIKAPTFFMFVAVLIICDMMGLQFLFFVTNEGSWLDIGTSISHYCIVQFMILAVMLLYAVSTVLTGASLMDIHAKLAGILRGDAVALREQTSSHYRM